MPFRPEVRDFSASWMRIKSKLVRIWLHSVLCQVQYPGLQKQFSTDIATMAVLSKALAWVRIYLAICKYNSVIFVCCASSRWLLIWKNTYCMSHIISHVLYNNYGWLLFLKFRVVGSGEDNRACIFSMLGRSWYLFWYCSYFRITNLSGSYQSLKRVYWKSLVSVMPWLFNIMIVSS